MRLFEIFENRKRAIMEGGNVFDDAVNFDHAEIDKILATVNNIMKPTGAQLIPIGSGATPSPGKYSGDLDVIVDQEVMSNYFGLEKPVEIKKAIGKLFNDKGFDTRVIGINTHVRVPLKQGSAQVDIMLVPHAEMVSKFHMHSIPQGSKYKGLHKQILLSKVARDKGLKWSGFKGLIDPQNDPKGENPERDIDAIAKMLLGDNATAQDLGSVETILSKLPPADAERLEAELMDDPAVKR